MFPSEAFELNPVGLLIHCGSYFYDGYVNRISRYLLG
jgi:hypothetical protein